MPLVRILEVELYPTLLSKARSFGLSDDWVQVRILHGQIVCHFFFLLLVCNVNAFLFDLNLSDKENGLFISLM